MDTEWYFDLETSKYLMQQKYLLIVISIHFDLLLQACAHNLRNNKNK